MLSLSPPHMMRLLKENRPTTGGSCPEFQVNSIHSVSSLDSCPTSPVQNEIPNQSMVKENVCKNLSPRRRSILPRLKSSKSARRWPLQPPKIESVEFIELDDHALMKNILQALIEKGETKLSYGDYLGAATAFNDALTIQRNFFDRYDSLASTGSILNAIGIVLSQLGDDFQTLAMNSFDKAIEIRQNSLGPGDKVTADSVHNLWILLHNIRDKCLNEGNQFNCFR